MNSKCSSDPNHAHTDPLASGSRIDIHCMQDGTDRHYFTRDIARKAAMALNERSSVEPTKHE